jgi:predicted DNA-binding transcriptional regulator AlpA
VNDGQRPLLGLTDAARFVGVSRSTLHAWTTTGVLPQRCYFQTPGQQTWYRRAALLGWLAGDDDQASDAQRCSECGRETEHFEGNDFRARSQFCGACATRLDWLRGPGDHRERAQ